VQLELLEQMEQQVQLELLVQSVLLEQMEQMELTD